MVTPAMCRPLGHAILCSQGKRGRGAVPLVYTGVVLSLVSEARAKLRIFNFFTHLTVERCPFLFIYLRSWPRMPCSLGNVRELHKPGCHRHRRKDVPRSPAAAAPCQPGPAARPLAADKGRTTKLTAAAAPAAAPAPRKRVGMRDRGRCLFNGAEPRSAGAVRGGAVRARRRPPEDARGGARGELQRHSGQRGRRQALRLHRGRQRHGTAHYALQATAEVSAEEARANLKTLEKNLKKQVQRRRWS